MLLNDDILVIIGSANRKHYEDLGYVIPRYRDNKKRLKIKKGTKILVKAEHLLHSTKVDIRFECDYCKTKITVVCKDYYERKKHKENQKDCCFNCIHLKTTENCQKKYGVDCVLKLPSIREKIKKTNQKRYNSDYYINTKESQVKRQELCLERHGVNHFSKVAYVKDKIRKSQNLSFEYVNEFFEEAGYTLISPSYFNRTAILQFTCKKHPDLGIQYGTYGSLQQGNILCSECSKERKRELYQHDFDFVKSVFIEKGLVLLEESYINEQTQMKYECNVHQGLIQSTTFGSIYQQNTSCPLCALEGRSGVNHYNWQGGITDLSKFLRIHITNWKKSSMKNCNYKCVITGQKFHNIHHLYGFYYIMRETFQNTNLSIKQCIKDYSDLELKQLIDECVRLHDVYELGICLHRAIHKLFHNIYGTHKNTPDQFEEFKQRLRQGEFNTYLQESNLQLAI